MLKPLATTKNGLYRYQAQEHKDLIRSLELECRYCQRGIEQQLRQYRKVLGRLSMTCRSSSLSLDQDKKISITLPALQSINTGCGGKEGTETLHSTSVGRNEESDSCFLENCHSAAVTQRQKKRGESGVDISGERGATSVAGRREAVE
ncbi:hypothetical protein JZ751_002774 [Albula glossodonta]|uniref:Uncharacterized protein n=1 Tax=Albula glossodonta TaxID=121402 RepID=A0A8T2NJ30_9TELE|nr:hypothetical protein JZ751_002774 [Albula glossodonta]